MIAGLGNPGRRYEGTRHNLGFEAVSALARAHPGGRTARRFRSEAWEGIIESREIILILPQTYMNRSGGAVREASEGCGIPPERVIVVCDDIALPLAKIRLRRKGSAGSHKGLQSVIDALGTESFHRLRIGIGDPGELDAEDYVLSPFHPDERPQIEGAVKFAVRAIETWLSRGIEEAMGTFNG